MIEEVEEKESERGEGADLLGEVGGEGLSDQKKLNERKQKRKGVKCDIHV